MQYVLKVAAEPQNACLVAILAGWVALVAALAQLLV